MSYAYLKNTHRNISTWLDAKFFPEVEIYNLQISLLQQVVLFLVLFILFSLLGLLLPAVGYDWVNFFSANNTPIWYPPWVEFIVNLLTWPALIGITMASVLIAIIKRAKYLLAAVFAVFTLPLFWTIFLGQLDGLVVLGLSGLPWLAPLALIKPQVSIFAFSARRSYFLSLIIVLVVSISIWRSWPAEVFSIFSFDGGRFIKDNDIAFGLWGLPIACTLIFFSRGDIDMLMAGGIFVTPYLLPYNLLLLVPAIARLKPGQALIACVLTWMPLSANWIGPFGWWLTWLFVVWLWFGLANKRYDITQNFNCWLANKHKLLDN